MGNMHNEVNGHSLLVITIALVALPRGKERREGKADSGEFGLFGIGNITGRVLP